jgi:hypothetical protein
LTIARSIKIRTLVVMLSWVEQLCCMNTNNNDDDDDNTEQRRTKSQKNHPRIRWQPRFIYYTPVATTHPAGAELQQADHRFSESFI